jgi:spermidine synthase
MKIFTIFLLALLLPWTANAAVLYEGDSQYQHILVRELDNKRCLFFVHPETHIKHYQGCLYPARPLAQLLPFSRFLLASLLVNPKPDRVLVIGMGVGSVPMAIRHAVPTAFIETVDLDPAVIEIAKQYFQYRDDEMTRSYAVDGRVFVKKALEKGIKYDLIVLDAMNEQYIPEHLLTVEFLREVKRLLSPNGIVAANTFAKSRLYDHESVTYSAVYGDFYNMKYDGDRSSRIIIASGTKMPPVSVIQQNSLNYAKLYWGDFGINVNDLLTAMDDEKDWDQSARLLTDQYSPSNLLNANKPNVAVMRFFAFLEDALQVHTSTTIGVLLLIVVLFMFLIGWITSYLQRRFSAAKPELRSQL